ncbi:MAG: OpgC domain-containing protein [Rhodobacteraceae bacterium]|nr:OpgC domain-containing protein [Paracoccaceae bacterium]
MSGDSSPAPTTASAAAMDSFRRESAPPPNEGTDGTIANTARAETSRKKPRDIRLDFFRGVGMFIIFTAHMGPYNPWVRWIPARFGYSDATEIFVFCSGAASAMAFLAVFETRGWWLGTARILWRMWQIYWCHIAMFFAIVASLAWVDANFELSRSYVQVLNVARFFDNAREFTPALLMMTYVPNYFDILVMYIVILALIPVVAGLSIAPKRAALGAVLALWAVAYPLALTPSEAGQTTLALGWIASGAAAFGLFYALSSLKQPGPIVFVAGLWLLVSQPWVIAVDIPIFTGLNLPAEITSDRQWFFNPFAWQLVFFTGFAFAVGWLPRPPVDNRLIALAIVVVALAIPIRFWGIVREVELFQEIRSALSPLGGKSFFGVLRYIHFLAIAYLAWVAAGEAGSRLPQTGFGGRIVTVVRRVGQQSLAVFVASMLLARLVGIWLSETARPNELGEVTFTQDLIVAAGNLGGYAILVGVAYLARYYRNPPWSPGKTRPT